MSRLIVAMGIAIALAAGGVTDRTAAGNSIRCAVSLPQTTPPASASGYDAASFNYGTESLRVNLWRRGILLVGELPNGGSYATMDASGVIHAKVGWWRGAPGRLEITGRRLDAAARSLRAHVPTGYGRTGFQPAGLLFPTMGCWRVVGTVGAERISFVVRVRLAPRSA